jgi:hypothetical protein
VGRGGAGHSEIGVGKLLDVQYCTLHHLSSIYDRSSPIHQLYIINSLINTMSYDSSPNASTSAGPGMKSKAFLKNALDAGKPGIGMWLT